MTVGAVIVSYQTPNLTRQAAASALQATMDQVVVIDNASRDDTAGQLESLRDHRLLILESDANAGFGSAANRAADDIRTSAVVFLNSDAQITAEAMGTLQRELDRAGGRVLVGPRLVSPDGRIQRSAGLLPRPSD